MSRQRDKIQQYPSFIQTGLILRFNSEFILFPFSFLSNQAPHHGQGQCRQLFSGNISTYTDYYVF